MRSIINYIFVSSTLYMLCEAEAVISPQSMGKQKTRKMFFFFVTIQASQHANHVAT